MTQKIYLYKLFAVDGDGFAQKSDMVIAQIRGT